MTKRTNGAAPVAPRPRPRSGMHIDPRRKLSAPRELWALWDRASEHSDGASWAEWARGALIDAAADELGLDPVTLRKLAE
jgi:hypothetical protein